MYHPQNQKLYQFGVAKSVNALFRSAEVTYNLSDVADVTAKLFCKS
jgi:hypothetical protein